MRIDMNYSTTMSDCYSANSTKLNKWVIPVIMCYGLTSTNLLPQQTGPYFNLLPKAYVAIHEKSRAIDDTYYISTRDLIHSIRQVFSLSITELADLLHVSRPTVYAYLEGKQQPQLENRQRLERLAQYAKQVQTLALDLTFLIKRPLFDGRSLLDLLKDDELSISLQNILKDLKMEQERLRTQREKLKADFAQRPFITDDYLPDIPLYEG